MAFVIPICFFDAPLVIDTTVTPIPASSGTPLQVVANTGINTGVGVDFVDNTGDFIGVYIGPYGQEQLLCIIGNGLSGQAWGKIPPNSRISLRAMKNVAVTQGLLTAAIVSI